MFAVQRITTQTPRLLKLSEVQRRTMLGTPPRVKVSAGERWVHGILLYVGIMAVPIYISCNVKNYNAQKNE